MSDLPGCPCSICECEDKEARRRKQAVQRLLGPRIQVDLEEWRNARTSKND